MFLNRRKRTRNIDAIKNINHDEVIEFTQEDEVQKSSTVSAAHLSNKEEIFVQPAVQDYIPTKKKKINVESLIFINDTFTKGAAANDINEAIFAPVTAEEIEKVEDESEKSNDTNQPQAVVLESSEEEDNIKDIVHEKMNQIKELKEQTRKCLLEESNDGLYGKSSTGKDMLSDIYKLITEEDESDNEVQKWEKEQYKSGINTNTLKHKEVPKEIVEVSSYFAKIKEKIDSCDLDNIISSIEDDTIKDKECANVLNKRKKEYLNELEKIKDNDLLIVSKLNSYINQYYKIKEDIVGESENDKNQYYISE